MPLFDQTFTGSGFNDVFVEFIPDKQRQVMFLGEPLDHLCLMRLESAREVIGEAGVQRSERLIGDDVNVGHIFKQAPTWAPARAGEGPTSKL